MELTFLQLTKSSKYGKYCVAGIDIRNDSWVRLVSSDLKSDGAISSEMLKDNENYPCFPLKIFKVNILQSLPTQYQKENKLIDEYSKTEYIGKEKVDALDQYVSNEDFVFKNTSYFLYENQMDGTSLGMFEVSNISIHQEVNEKLEKRTKLDFTYKSRRYINFSITDPLFFDKNGKIDHALIVVSLPNKPYNNNKFFKFVAKIFEL
ncbi:MAG: hypothetical protein MJ250_04365 [Alphaproteobacteria bacterium]|nr:hypothetical protein [Alphaproteobacteria bacterium]